MDSQLKLLISLYEEERVRLQRLIEECIEETEYLMAHYHSEALFQLNGRLQTLHNLDDKLYDEKERRHRTIIALQKEMRSESSDYLKEHFEKMLLRERQALERLNEPPIQATFPDNETLLDETLKKLADRKIKNLKVILKKTDNLLLAFSNSKKALKVTLPYVKQLTNKWILHEGHINHFRNLGFEFAENESKLILTLTGDKEVILKRMKIILSKIVFEIFYFKKFDNESYIQFTDIASR